ncbi:MAG: hypothetical protein ACU837_01270 [Gammaproteobacteria bacterium]
MAQIFINGFVFPAMAGFFFFGKRSEVRDSQDSSLVPAEGLNELTGVARYLKSHEKSSLTTGVSKYIEDLNRFPASGVTKYLRKQAIAEREAAKQESPTGVAKYLRNQKDLPPMSGVAKYINKMDRTPVSGVAKYLAKQVVAAKTTKPPQTTGVTKYLQLHAQIAPTGVAKYLTKLSIAERQAESERLAEAERLAELEKQMSMETGVGRYLRNRG